MSIREIAKELYRLHRAVDRLEEEFKHASPQRRVELEEAVRKARAEREAVKRILDGKKAV